MTEMKKKNQNVILGKRTTCKLEITEVWSTKPISLTNISIKK